MLLRVFRCLFLAAFWRRSSRYRLGAMKRPLCSVVLAAGLMTGKGALFNPIGVSSVLGTAVNSTQVIGAGSSGATAVNLSSGAQSALGTPSLTIDAGQYNDNFTMYLDNSGTLRIISNVNGDPLRSPLSVGDAFGVSGAINVGGTMYCVVAGTVSGVRALNLQNGQMTALGTATNYNFTGASGLDAFLRPGGSSINDIAIGIVRTPLPTEDGLDIYIGGNLIQSYTSDNLIDANNGSLYDVSFSISNGGVWFGTDTWLYDQAFDFSLYAVSPPGLAVSVTNGSVVVTWTGRTLAASTTLTNWSPVATAPATATQIFPPPPYTEPLTNATRFFRAAW